MVDASQVIECLGVVGLLFQSHLENLLGAIQVTGATGSESQVKQNIEICGLGLKGLREGSLRILKLLPLDVGHAHGKPQLRFRWHVLRELMQEFLGRRTFIAQAQRLRSQQLRSRGIAFRNRQSLEIFERRLALSL